MRRRRRAWRGSTRRAVAQSWHRLRRSRGVLLPDQQARGAIPVPFGAAVDLLAKLGALEEQVAVVLPGEADAAGAADRVAAERERGMPEQAPGECARVTREQALGGQLEVVEFGGAQVARQVGRFVERECDAVALGLD